MPPTGTATLSVHHQCTMKLANGLQVIVLTPLRSRRDFLLESLQNRQVDINQWLKRLIKDVNDGCGDRFARKDLRELAYTLLRVPPKPTRDPFQWRSYKETTEMPEPALMLALRASFVLRDCGLFEQALKVVSKIDPTQFDDLGKAIYYHNIEPHHPEYLPICLIGWGPY